MENVPDWIRNNIEWIVTGLFVPLIGLIYKTKAARKREIVQEWEALNAQQQGFTDRLVQQISEMRTEIAGLKDEIHKLVSENMELRRLLPNVAVSP